MSDSPNPPASEQPEQPKDTQNAVSTGDVDMKASTSSSTEEAAPKEPEEPPLPDDVLNATPEESVPSSAYMLERG